MPFEKHFVDIEENSFFSKIFVDYIGNKPSLAPFYKYPPQLSSFRSAINDVSKSSFNRKKLVEVLREQYRKLYGDESSKKKALANIELLADEKTFTVTTGHQLCLFTGPLYFIYKIISTINLASRLKKEFPDCNFVPVYWMASEDHDFEEINHVNVFGWSAEWKYGEMGGNWEWKEGKAVDNRQLTEDKKEKVGGAIGSIQLAVDKKGEEEKVGMKSSYGAVGRLNTLSLINGFLKEMEGFLRSENGKYITELLSHAYVTHSNLAEATRALVNELFSDHGLVIVDGDHAELKKEFVGVLKDDMIYQTNFKLVNETIKGLEKSGYKAQVKPREINCFYMKDNLRERIIKDGLKFKVQSSKLEFSEEELLAELKDFPERFSPNVVLRPLYQQKILPNIAYVGGPGEIAYWLEYKAMFEHHQINFPILMPRNFVMWVEEKQGRQMKNLGIRDSDLFKTEEELIKMAVLKNSENEISLSKYEEKIKEIYQEITHYTEGIDPSLKASVQAELQRNINALEKLKEKLLRAEKQKQSVTVSQVKKIKEKLFPDGMLQERYANFITYYVWYGKAFFDTLLEAEDPFDRRFVVLEEVPLPGSP